MEKLRFRNGVELRDPLNLALLFLENDYSYRTYDSVAVPLDNVLQEADVRRANSIGARMSTAEIAAILERRPTIETALAKIPGHASLASAEAEIPWAALRDLYAGMSGISGVGLAK